MSEIHDWKDDPRLVAYALEEWAALSDADVTDIEEALGKNGAQGDPRAQEALAEIQALIPDIEQALRSEGASGDAGFGGETRAEIALAARRGASYSGLRMPAMAAAALALLGGGIAWQLGTGPASFSEQVEGEVAGIDDGVHSGDDYGLASEESPPTGGRESVAQWAVGGLESRDGVAGRERSAARPKPKADGKARAKEAIGVLGGAEEPISFRKKLGPAKPSARAPEQGSAAPESAPVSSSVSSSGRAAGARDARVPVFEVAESVGVPGSPGSPVRPKAMEGVRGLPSEVLPGVVAAGLAPDLVPDLVPENPFIDAALDPFSTFSIDVDTASYAAARAAIQSGSRPARESVRVEEFVNYFSYGDEGPAPGDPRPFAVHVDIGAAPWAPHHRLVRIGLKASAVSFDERKRGNLVFLVDVSGSMRRANKLPLVKKALTILTESLHPEDRVAIAVYASAEGLALDSTSVAAREAILQSLERLREGGSTDGGAGIQLAYSVAREHFVEGGVNRVVLCTDGDFNVGLTSAGELEELIAREAESGVELTVLGFGGGSVSGDERMEALSNRGNGNYALIDSELEARKVLASEVGGTLLTVAKDVKIQVAWNPKLVGAFRLIGYENRMLAHSAFLDDSKDAGEIGAGHGVTALYEVIPASRPDPIAQQGQQDGASQITDSVAKVTAGSTAGSTAESTAGSTVGQGPGGGMAVTKAFEGDGLLEVRLRYKEPGAETSVGFSVQASDGGAGFNGAPLDLRFSASVAAFAMKMRGSKSVGDLSLEEVRNWSLESKGPDPGGLREAFVQLIEQMIEGEKRREPATGR